MRRYRVEGTSKVGRGYQRNAYDLSLNVRVQSLTKVVERRYPLSRGQVVVMGSEKTCIRAKKVREKEEISALSTDHKHSATEQPRKYPL